MHYVMLENVSSTVCATYWMVCWRYDKLTAILFVRAASAIGLLFIRVVNSTGQFLFLKLHFFFVILPKDLRYGTWLKKP